MLPKIKLSKYSMIYKIRNELRSFAIIGLKKDKKYVSYINNK